ncbi:50S ribosomal protein L7/L12-like [Cocos nucifera]|uniref:50S ribosomal protein L7/L12-like n=1 Tax=Cocos nucifera TaxID=13894 RepID=A0A8K0IB17_COCNU|nr:50S ribosomal protein L7/L12-like [Cocos nucifera]
MSFLLRSGHRLLSSKPSISIPILRRFSLPAKEDADDGGEPVFDQRKLPADYDPSTFDPATARSPPSDHVWRLVDEVSTLTLADVAELSSILVRKIGLKNQPVIGVMNAGTGGTGPAAGAAGAPGKEEKKQEKTVFELRLDSFDAASKIKVIKEVRGLTDLGLKEAKDLVEKTPTIIKRGVSKEEGEQIIEKMKAVGAKVVME